MSECESEHASSDLFRTFVLSNACVMDSAVTLRLGELVEWATRASLAHELVEPIHRVCATAFPNFSCSIHLGLSVGRHVAT